MWCWGTLWCPAAALLRGVCFCWGGSCWTSFFGVLSVSQVELLYSSARTCLRAVLTGMPHFCSSSWHLVLSQFAMFYWHRRDQLSHSP